MKEMKREKLLMIITAAAVGILIFDKLILGPMVDSYDSDLEEIEMLERKVMQQHALIDSIGSWKRKKRSFDEASLPESKSESENLLLKTFSMWGKGVGLAITSMRPSWKSERGKEPTVDLRLSGNGSMSSIVKFIAKVETNSLPLEIRTLKISGSKSGKVMGIEMSVNAILTSEDKEG